MKNDLEIVCPCCLNKRKSNQLTRLLAFYKMYEYEHVVRVLKGAVEEHFRWACDVCIRDKKAILGIPKKQNFKGFANPFFAYYDQHKKCQKCQINFTFGKEEQQYWYEELGFIIWSKPINCVPCRQAIRKPKVDNTRLSFLVKNIEVSNIDWMEELIDLYNQMDKFDKSKYYLALLKKNVDNPSDKNIQERIENIKKRILMLSNRKNRR